MKLDFEIAVGQQTMARDQTFEGFRTPGAHRCPRDSHAHIWSIGGPILLNHIHMLKIMLWGALPVATSRLNTVLSKLDTNWQGYEQYTICPYLGIHTKYYRFWPINWAKISIFLNETNFI